MLLKEINRRQALALSGTAAATIIGAGGLSAKVAPTLTGSSDGSSSLWRGIENIIQAEGMFSDGVFSIEIDRNDIDNVTLHGVPIKPSFEINGTLYFQKIDENTVIMNSDLALKSEEIDPFIDQLLIHDLRFQAEHQHMYDFDPIVWYIHFRKIGDPLTIARSVKRALDVTSTPFPQTMPTNPTTPLPAERIARILGASPTIGSDGVVTYDVPRRNPIRLAGVLINPYLNVATSIAFEPLGNGQAAAIPDFGMVGLEINPVMKVMRRQGWDIGCLYNQETEEDPQLFFSHQFKTGDPLQLAQEIRNGLNLMNMRFE